MFVQEVEDGIEPMTRRVRFTPLERFRASERMGWMVWLADKTGLKKGSEKYHDLTPPAQENLRT